jgi:DNA-binding LacI/PurR family transcriptional regulator
MPRKTTIKDVAARAAVSYQTVSRVINGKGEVSQEAQARVEQAIAELGYQPNAIARSMVRGRTHTLGFIAPNLIDYTFACLAEGAKFEARKHNYLLMAVAAANENEVGMWCNELVGSGRVDGLIAVNPYADGRNKYFEQLAEKGAHLVYFGTDMHMGTIPSVQAGNEEGAYLAVNHLIALGHTRIAMMTGLPNEDSTQSRSLGYARAIRNAGLESQPELIEQGDWSASSGYQAMEQWLTSGKIFTALFAQNDRMAVGAIRAAREKGRHVPRDLAVVGFDDMPLASYFDPSLTTIYQDIFLHGQQGARILIETIEKPSRTPEHIVIPSQLVVRESSGVKISDSHETNP